MMFRFIVKPTILRQCLRCCQLTQGRHFRVTLVGCSGGIGQPLSLLLKSNYLISELTLQDLVDSQGVCVDLSHISTPCKVKYTLGKSGLDKSIKSSDLVVVTAGIPRKPNMDRDALFERNAEVIIEVACAVAKHSPKALFVIVTNPINILVPMAAEIMRQNGVYDPRRLFGVTTLDVLRAEQFISEIMNLNPCEIKIPVIGGHTGQTILPIFSQCKPKFNGDEACIAHLTKRIQFGGEEVIRAKAGKGSATLSTAYACYRFIGALLLGLKGIKSEPQCAYVQSSITSACFFASPLSFGPNGIEKYHDLPKLNDSEKKALDETIKALNKSIEKGIKHVQK